MIHPGCKYLYKEYSAMREKTDELEEGTFNCCNSVFSNSESSSRQRPTG